MIKSRSVCILIALIVVLISFNGCDINTRNNHTSVSQVVESTDNTISDSLESGPAGNPSDTEKVVLEVNGVKIVQSDSLYFCRFYNQGQKNIRTEGPFSKLPSVAMTEGNLIRVSLQGGTGIGTQWSLYYDFEQGLFSEVFTGVFDQNQQIIAYATQNKVIVQDIFDESKYYVEIASFQYALSYVAEPIKDVSFLNDGKWLVIAYLTGPDYLEVYDVIELDGGE